MPQKPVVSQYTYVYILKLNFDVIIRTFLVVKNEGDRKKNKCKPSRLSGGSSQQNHNQSRLKK